MDFTGLGSLFDFGKAVIERIFPDPAARAQATLELAKLQQTGELAQLAADTELMKGQLEANKVEAASTSWFVAGWRPFIGWICGFGLAYAAILEPFARFIAAMLGYKGIFPVVDWAVTSQILLGMLGLAGMRSYEKKNGVEGKR